jgi:hypothetical protein
VKTSLDTTADMGQKKAALQRRGGQVGGKSPAGGKHPDRVLPGCKARQLRDSGRA